MKFPVRISSFAFLVLLMLVATIVSHAQPVQDTLLEVEVKDHARRDSVTDQRNNFTAGQQKFQIDKIYKDIYDAQSLANLLAQQSSVFVKSYGVNSMATLSLRGSSAAQTSVLWNGVPILNPALGVADLSVLRTGLFQDISLQYGSSAALFGSGNVGGALMLDDGAVAFYDHKEMALNLGYGSYGRMDASIRGRVQTRKLSLSLNGFYQKATNDFKYLNSQGQDSHLDNAQLEGGGGLLNFDYNLAPQGSGRKEKLYGKVWWQQYDREIPPALFEQTSVKRQQDQSLRSMLGWQRSGKRATWYAKASYSRENLQYRDATETRNTVQQYYQETGLQYALNDTGRSGKEMPARHLLMVYVPLQYAAATGNNIATAQTQFRPALVAAYKFTGLSDRLNVNAALRQEWVNGNAAPLLPGIGGAYQVLNPVVADRRSLLQLQVRANVQRTYRIPTLNELYYFPGGNPDLKPEQGWSQDAGYALNLELGVLSEARRIETRNTHRFTFSHEASLFNRNIQDWIYWLGGAIWTPHNIARVHSRGVETNNKVEFVIGSVTLHAGLNYTYVLSTTEASYLPGDGSIGKQIPYTPRYNIQGNAGLQWRGRLFLNYNQTYAGYRFVTTDESQFLEPYSTGNVQATYTLSRNERMLTLSAQIQNIWNTAYEVVNGRPMPGRNFLLQVKLGLF